MNKTDILCKKIAALNNPPGGDIFHSKKKNKKKKPLQQKHFQIENAIDNPRQNVTHNNSVALRDTI